MTINRPDLTGLDPLVRAYIESLETELGRRRAVLRESPDEGVAEPAEPAEPPTTLVVVSVSAGGLAKRTPRHAYVRQRRGGMGVFDLDSSEDDPPAFLTVVDSKPALGGEKLGLVLLTNHARSFRVPLDDLPDSPVRSRGVSLTQRLPLRPDERLALVFPDRGNTYLVVVTQRGQVRRIRYHYLGESLRPGSILYDIKDGGPPAAVCWTPGDGELFIATRKGLGIRFPERQVPVRGCLGIRVDPDDAVVGVAPATPEGGVLLLGADGRGSIRLMPGFAANKEPGGGGKVALKTDRLAGVAPLRGRGEAAGQDDDIFAISRLGKIIRFRAGEIPPKEGLVQGVNCMTLRADDCMSFASSPAVFPPVADE